MKDLRASSARLDVTSLKPLQRAMAEWSETWAMKLLVAVVFQGRKEPQGGFKQAWTLKLMRSGSRCELPRGFIKVRNKTFVGGKSGYSQRNQC